MSLVESQKHLILNYLTLIDYYNRNKHKGLLKNFIHEAFRKSI